MAINKKFLGAVGLVLVLILGVYIAAAVVLSSRGVSGDSETVSLYFYNPSTKRLEAEEREIPRFDQLNDTVRTVISQLLVGPKSASRIRTIPMLKEETGQEEGLSIVGEIRSVNEGKIIEIPFSKEYYDLSLSDELILRASLVYTLTNIDGVESVSIYIESVDGVETPLTRSNGQQITEMSRDNMQINPHITPDKVNKQTVVLYFANEDATGLVSEQREIVVTNVSIERLVVESLIAGPQTEGRHAILTQDMQINDVTLSNERICYVDVTSSFIQRLPAESGARRLAVYSIVNSLIEMSEGNIRRVQFLIDSARIEDNTGGIDLSQPFEEDAGLILDK